MPFDTLSPRSSDYNKLSASKSERSYMPTYRVIITMTMSVIISISNLSQANTDHEVDRQVCTQCVMNYDHTMPYNNDACRYPNSIGIH